MLKVADAGKNHCEIVLVCGGNHLVIADRAARLDHRRNPVTRGFINAVTKRKERI